MSDIEFICRKYNILGGIKMSAFSRDRAISIEHSLRTLFNCGRAGFGGLVESDFIEVNPVVALHMGLATIYPSADDNTRNNIDTFINSIAKYDEKKIYEIEESDFIDILNRFNEIIK